MFNYVIKKYKDPVAQILHNVIYVIEDNRNHLYVFHGYHPNGAEMTLSIPKEQIETIYGYRSEDDNWEQINTESEEK